MHRQTFELPQVKREVEEISIDGGKVRLRTRKGQPCQWRDYKAANLDELTIEAFFQDNESLIGWVNQQPSSNPLVCLGDGHCGIWNIYAQIGSKFQRQEILDWYHLIENLGKVGGSNQRLDRVEALLGKGNIARAIQEFSDWKHESVDKFINYLNQHRERIVNYDYFQAEGISIGSGAIESTIKQIGRRIKISGAQWNSYNISQVLRHRCAYLNGTFST